MWFMGDFVGDGENGRKINFKKIKYGIEAYHFVLSKNAWFRFFQRSGAKICVKHQTSFCDVLEGWAKRESWVILKKSQKKAFEESKRSESRIKKLALSTLQQRFSWHDSTHWPEVMHKID